MEFSLNKCGAALYLLECGKFVLGKDIALPTSEEISTLEIDTVV